MDVPLHLLNLLVKDCIIAQTYQWNYQFLHQLVPDWILQHIHSIPIPLTNSPDVPLWNPNPYGKFTIRSTYNWLVTRDKNGIYPQIPWKNIWTLPCPSKIKTFLWQLVHQILPTSSFLYHRHKINSPLCSLCGKIDDDNHWLYECNVFTQLRTSIHWLNWQDLNVITLLCYPKCSIKHTAKIACLLWTMWIARNNAIFRNASINTVAIIQTAEFTFNQHFNTLLIPSTNLHTFEHNCQWTPSTLTTYKMNTDGGISNESHLAGIGAIIRNQQGQHVASLAANIGYASNITAELRAIRDGLLLLIKLGIRSIHIETDSLMAVHMITRQQAGKMEHRVLLQDIIMLVNKIEDVWFQFSFRETNQSADKLATFGKNNPYMYNSFLDKPPVWLLQTLSTDVTSVFKRTTTRLVLYEITHI